MNKILGCLILITVFGILFYFMSDYVGVKKAICICGLGVLLTIAIVGGLYLINK